MTGKPSRRTFRNRLEDMVGTLRNDIISGRYSPGDYLPSEQLLVEQFRLSNKSVRKGLDALVKDGLIVKEHRIGSKVVETAQLTMTTITLGVYGSLYRDMELNRLLEEFHSQHPAIRVSIVPIPNQPGLGSVKDYLEQGMIDVFSVNNTGFQQLVENDCIRLLMEQPVNGSVYPFLNRAFTIDGKLYVTPVIFGPLVLCYNKEHFSEAGLPEPDSSWTWDDAIRSAKALSRKNKCHGIYFNLLSDNRWPVFLLQSGARFTVNADGLYSLHGTKLLEGVTLCKEIIHNQDIFPHYLGDLDDDAQMLFSQGKISMVMTTYSGLNEMRKAKPAFDISPLPFLNEPRTLTVAIGMAVNRNSRLKEAAAKLARYFTTNQAQQLIRRHTYSIPSVKPVAEQTGEEIMYRPPRFHLYREILPSLRLHQELNLSTAAWEQVRNLLKLYWAETMDEATLLKRLETVFPEQGR